MYEGDFVTWTAPAAVNWSEINKTLQLRRGTGLCLAPKVGLPLNLPRIRI